MDSVIAWAILTLSTLIFGLKILISLPHKQDDFNIYKCNNDTYSIMEKNRKNRYKKFYY